MKAGTGRLLVVTALVAGCGRPAPVARASGPAVAAASEAGDWSFRVAAGPGARELSVEAELGPGSGDELSVDEGAEPFLEKVEVATAGGWEQVAASGTSWVVPGCRLGCRLRYRYRLEEAARSLGDIERATRAGEVLLAPPSTWLLHPLDQARVGRLRLAVDPGESRFFTGLFPATAGYEASTDDLAEAPYSAFGPLRRKVLSWPGGEVEVALGPGKFALDDGALERWVRRSAEAVVGYYGRLPVPHVTLFVLEAEGTGVVYGRTLGNGGASIIVTLGDPVTEEDLRRDWVLPHELIHLAFPSMPPHQSWIEEGLSTYLEPVARARAGQMDEREVWRDFVRSMPQGQPEAGDRGLDATPTWGRTYWGGAIFCLLADVEIRQRTGNQRSLDDALRAINRAGGSVARRWPLSRAIELGDEATGTTALRDLYQRLAPRPAPVDLGALWASLGVVDRGGRVTFDESAPQAEVRRAITARAR